ncbi:MAG: hypothetical protein RL685_4104 [Pseudomonadota bacterium]|jgi:hypothetical protein
MEKSKVEAEQINGNDEASATSEQLVVEIPTEIRAGVLVRDTLQSECGGSYACYSQRAQ